MKVTQHLANNLRQVYFGGNWTGSNLKDQLKGVSLDMASKSLEGLNTILALTYHIHYYLKGVMEVLNGGDLTIRDTYSFEHPHIQSESEWQDFMETLWTEAKAFISLVESLDDEILNTVLADEKYGSYYRNLAGIIEHAHYHLGQIAIIKKMLNSS